MTGEPITVLSDQESWELLQSQALGRIGLSVGGEPDIFPLNYVVDGERVVFRTGEGTKLAELAINGNVAFEVDNLRRRRWVECHREGTAERLESMRDRRGRRTAAQTVVATIKYNYVAINVSSISGRRFVFGPGPSATRSERWAGRSGRSRSTGPGPAGRASCARSVFGTVGMVCGRGHTPRGVRSWTCCRW